MAPALLGQEEEEHLPPRANGLLRAQQPFVLVVREQLLLAQDRQDEGEVELVAQDDKVVLQGPAHVGRGLLHEGGVACSRGAWPQADLY